MTDTPPSDVLGALPRTRPHRRSDKRASKPAATARPAATAKPKAPSKPAATAKPKTPAKSKAAAKPRAAAKSKAAAKPKRAESATRPKLVAVPPAAEQAGPTPFYMPSSSQGSRVAAQKAAKPAPSNDKVDILGTAVQAAAELAEIGISATARAIRGAVARLPRP
jgi:hypothetical protein